MLGSVIGAMIGAVIGAVFCNFLGVVLSVFFVRYLSVFHVKLLSYPKGPLSYSFFCLRVLLLCNVLIPNIPFSI